MFFFHSFTALHCCLTLPYLLQFKIPLPDNWSSDVTRFSFLRPHPTWPPPCGHLSFSSFKSALVLLHCLSRLFGDALSGCSFSGRSFWIPPLLSEDHLSISPSYQSPPYCSIPPEHLFCFLSYPDLILGDFNIHHPLADPCRSLSEREFTLSARYLDFAFDIPYHLLNTPGSTLVSLLTPSRDLPFWTWPLRIPPSPPLSPCGTRHPLPPVQTTSLV